MQIGCFGDIVFEVGPSTVKTFQKMTEEYGARITQHKRHLAAPATEFTGPEEGKITLTARVSKYLGANPQRDIDLARYYTTHGVAQTLVIGSRSYGAWMIQSVKIDRKNSDRFGNLTDAELSFSFTEVA